MVGHDPEAIIEIFAANLKQQRTDRSVSQMKLASAAEVDLRYLQRMEAAEINVSIRTLARLAYALEVEPDALLAEPRTGKKAKLRGKP